MSISYYGTDIFDDAIVIFVFSTFEFPKQFYLIDDLSLLSDLELWA